MSKKPIVRTDSASFRTGSVLGSGLRPKSTPFADGEPPRKPDWLLIFVSILFLLSLLIVWLVDIPSLLPK